MYIASTQNWLSKLLQLGQHKKLYKKLLHQKVGVALFLLVLLIATTVSFSASVFADTSDSDSPPANESQSAAAPSPEETARAERRALLQDFITGQSTKNCGAAIYIDDNTNLAFSKTAFDDLPSCSSKRTCVNFLGLTFFPEDSNFDVDQALSSLGVTEDWFELSTDEELFDLNCNFKITGSEKQALDRTAIEKCTEEVYTKRSSGGGPSGEEDPDTNNGNNNNQQNGSRYKAYYDGYITNNTLNEDAILKQIQKCVEGKVTLNPPSVQDIPFTSEFYDIRDLIGGNTGNLDADATQGGPVIAFILRIVNFLIQISGVVVLLMLVVGAYLMLTAAGNEDQIGKGKSTIVSALVGLAIVIFAFMIVSFVQAIIF